MAVATPIFTKIADHAQSRKQVMVPGMLGAAVMSGFQPYCDTSSQFLCVGLVGALANALVMPNIAAFIMDNSAQDDRAQALALRLMAQDVGMLVGASSMGVLAHMTDVPTVSRSRPSVSVSLSL